MGWELIRKPKFVIIKTKNSGKKKATQRVAFFEE